MARAEFEEKEFELAFGIELAEGPGRRGAIFAAGQVLEAIVGYDAAGDPDPGHAIWSVLRAPRPAGVRLVPHLWSPGITPHVASLPLSPVSLILQYKRPEYLRGARAAQWHLWGQPYFRFSRTTRQHGVLRRLEHNLGSEALVRYAAPAFWQRADLEVAHLQRRVLALSGFVSPSAIGSHRTWTYTRPGVDGRANPSGGPRLFETFEAMFARLIAPSTNQRDIVLASNGISGHVRGLGDAARWRQPALRREVDRWVAGVQRAVELDGGQVEDLRAFASVTSLLFRLGASWHLVDPQRERPMI